MIPPIQFILIAGLLYIYKVFNHLQQWLQVIRMKPQPDMCSLRPKSDDVLGAEAGASVEI